MDEKYVLALIDGTAITLKHSEGKEVGKRLTDITTSEMALIIGESIIMKTAVSYLVTQSEYDVMRRLKAGEWQCIIGHWHKKSETECKEAVKKSDEMVDVIGSDVPVSMTEILKDKNKPEGERKYKRDNGNWYLIKKVEND